MSDLVGNHIVGFLTSRLIYVHLIYTPVNSSNSDVKYIFIPNKAGTMYMYCDFGVTVRNR